MANKVLKKKQIDQDVWTLALERTHRAFDLFDHIAVSFSGGKDSTAALHVALEVAAERDRLPLDVFFWDEEAIHPETIDYMHRIGQRQDVNLRWLCIPVKHRNACSRSSPWWFPWASEDKEKWCRELPPEAITELPGFNRQTLPECNGFLFPKSKGSVGIIMGIRAAESLRRYRSVANRTTDNYISVDPQAKHCHLVKPIYDWTTEDVWSAPKIFSWDYNRTYDVFEKAGVTRHDQRVCPPYGEEPLRGLYQYGTCWPSLWERMIHRVPGAATAARYSRSPLYAFGDLPGWDANADPKQLIQTALQRWPDSTRTEIVDRINVEIRNHHRKSKDPIPAETPGSTGVTWKYLYQLAIRGDIKGRRTPAYATHAS